MAKIIIWSSPTGHPAFDLTPILAWKWSEFFFVAHKSLVSTLWVPIEDVPGFWSRLMMDLACRRAMYHAIHGSDQPLITPAAQHCLVPALPKVPCSLVWTYPSGITSRPQRFATRPKYSRRPQFNNPDMPDFQFEEFHQIWPGLVNKFVTVVNRSSSSKVRFLPWFR